MTSLNLLVDDDYLEEFINSFDKEKVRVVENDFDSNKRVLENVLISYKNSKEEFIPYFDSMKNLTIWLKERES